MEIECYAQRLLNPFRGCVQVIRYEAAEAVTSDGEHWDIYVRNSALVSDLRGAKTIQTSDIRYGSWSVAKGLKRGPINPYDDFLSMEAMGAVVYEYLLQAHTPPPFPFRDSIECWLLDSAGQPLALLESALAEDELQVVEPRWRAGYAASERFQSGAWQRLPEIEVAQCSGAGDCLTRYINRCAGPKPVAQWFRRDADGSGTGLMCQGSPSPMAGVMLPGDRFPAFHLDCSRHDPAHQLLIQEYLDWQAPWLLLLPNMERTQRARLEKTARTQAAEVSRQYRLYPDIVNQQEINAALVEAMLVNSRAGDNGNQDAEMSTFYIELNPAGGEYL